MEPDKKKEKNIYPLCGVLTCSLCGSPYSSYNRNKKRYYRCTGYSKRGNCPAGAKAVIEASKIEKIVEEIFIHILGDMHIVNKSYLPIVYWDEFDFCKSELKNLRKEREDLLSTAILPEEIDKLKENFISICKKIKQVRGKLAEMEDEIMDSQESVFNIEKEIHELRDTKKLKEILTDVSLETTKEIYKKFIRVKFDAIMGKINFYCTTAMTSSFDPLDLNGKDINEIGESLKSFSLLDVEQIKNDPSWFENIDDLIKHLK